MDIIELVFEEGTWNTQNLLALIEHINDLIDYDLKPNEVKIMSSSGASVVLVVNDIPFAFQHYSYKGNYLRVKRFISAMEKEPLVDLQFSVSSGFGRRKLQENIDLTYDLFDYLVKVEYCIPKLQTIVWELINTINRENTEFIYTNLYKILWDLGKSLSAIHQRGFVHGDATLDNAGFKTSMSSPSPNFVYFDFDSSKPIQEVEGGGSVDFNTLIHSVEFHLDINLNLLPNNYLPSLIRMVKAEMGFSSFQETVDYLESLEIIENNANTRSHKRKTSKSIKKFTRELVQEGGGYKTTKKFALPSGKGYKVYGHNGCGYTQQALNFLSQSPEIGEFTFYDADEIWPDKSFREGIDLFQKKLTKNKIGNHTSIPMIFDNNNKFIGGFSDLKK